MSDLRNTLGWRLTRHARQAAERRGFTVTDVLMAAAAPDVRYTAYGYGEGREIRQLGQVAVAVYEPSMSVLTVLWRRSGQWTDDEAARRPAA